MILYKNLLLLLLFLAIKSFAADELLHVQLMQHLPQPATGWIMLRPAVPVVQGRMQLKNPISVVHPELLCMDAKRRTLLVPQIGKGKIDYRLISASGALLGGLTLLRDNDLPAPAVELDAKAQRLYFMEVDGRLSAYDFRGTCIWEIPPAQGYAFTYENTFFSYWNSQTHTLFTAFSAPHKNGPSGFHTFIREYDADGQLLLQRVLPGVQTLKLVCDSAEQKKVLLAKIPSFTAGASILLLDSLNRTVWQKAGVFRKALFLSNNRILLTGKQNLHLIDALSGQKLRDFHPAMDEQLIADVVSDGQAKVAVVLGAPLYSAGKLRYGAPHVYFIDLKTEYHKRVSLPGKIYLPRAVYLTETGQLQLGCEKGLYQIEFRVR